MSKYGVVSVAVSFIDEDNLKSLSYGYANRKKKIKVTPNTIFQVASISKSLTAMGVLRLVEEGKIHLDDSIETYLKRWHLPKSTFDHNKVTIRLLLSHTGGISVAFYPGFSPDSELPTLEESLSGKISEGLSGLIYNEPVRIVKKPGIKFSYSGGGYTILQLMIEEVTGLSFTHYMQTQILYPLKMKNSSFNLPIDHLDILAIGYSGFFYDSASPNYIYTAKAAAGLYSTASDLIHFLNVFIKENREGILLTPELIHSMTDPLIKAPDGYYGLGCHIRILKDSSHLVSHHGKNRGGWNSAYVVNQEKKVGFVFLSNSESGNDLEKDIENQWITWIQNRTVN